MLDFPTNFNQGRIDKIEKRPEALTDDVVNKFIDEHYNTFPLKQRLEKIKKFDFSVLGPNIQQLIRSINKLSFYEQKEFVKQHLDQNNSATQLIISRLVTLVFNSTILLSGSIISTIKSLIVYVLC